MQILKKAGSLFLEIIKNPIPFLKNLINAVKKGFTQFVSNIGKHLVKGLMSWLFGQIAQTGLTLPTSFSLSGIFDFVRQVLGLTYDNIRQRVVKVIGEKNMERIETVAGEILAPAEE